MDICIVADRQLVMQKHDKVKQRGLKIKNGRNRAKTNDRIYNEPLKMELLITQYREKKSL